MHKLINALMIKRHYYDIAYNSQCYNKNACQNKKCLRYD